MRTLILVPLLLTSTAGAQTVCNIAPADVRKSIENYREYMRADVRAPDSADLRRIGAVDDRPAVSAYQTQRGDFSPSNAERLREQLRAADVPADVRETLVASARQGDGYEGARVSADVTRNGKTTRVDGTLLGADRDNYYFRSTEGDLTIPRNGTQMRIVESRRPSGEGVVYQPIEIDRIPGGATIRITGRTEDGADFESVNRVTTARGHSGYVPGQVNAEDIRHTREVLTNPNIELQQPALQLSAPQIRAGEGTVARITAQQREQIESIRPGSTMTIEYRMTEKTYGGGTRETSQTVTVNFVESGGSGVETLDAYGNRLVIPWNQIGSVRVTEQWLPLVQPRFSF